jgi:hypothetical protein
VLIGPFVLVGAAGVLLLLVGGSLALWGQRFDRAQRRFNRRSLAARGTVVGHTAYTVDFRDRLEAQTEARVRFRAVDGQFYEAKGPVHDARTPPLPPIGTVIEVRYDPTDPRESSTRGPRGRAGLARALFLVGLGIALLGVLLTAGALVARVAGGW